MILNIIVLILEVLYYSLFLKFAKNENNLWRYILGFIIVSIIGVFIKTNYLISYVLLIILIVSVLKFIARIKIKNFDILVIVIMLLIKILIEGISVIIFYNLLNMNTFIVTLIFMTIKLLFVILLRKRINKVYNVLNKKWNNNDFNIRYIFSIFILIYTIISIFVLL